MALDAFKCKICIEDYDYQCHRPLSLDCGHTFCELCIQNLGHANSKICPTCRKLTNKSTDQLPVIFALIPSQESTTARSNVIDDDGDKCNDHGCVLDRFCAECGEMVCRKCVKNSHATHRSEFIDDILHMDPDAATLNRELENKLIANINRLSKSMSVPIKICKIIDELPWFKKSLEDWKDRLCSQKKLTEQHLKDWNDARNKCTKEKCQLFNKLCSQWKGVVLPPHPVVELTSLTKKLEELNKCAAHLQELMQKYEDASERKKLSNASEDFLDGDYWRVDSDKDSQGAISSVRAGKIPRQLEVVSSPRTPIQHLPEVLNFLGSPCAERSISAKPLDTFWAPSNTTDSRNLQAFINKFGHKMREFYGSPHEVATLCRVNPGLCLVGVRLSQTLTSAQLGQKHPLGIMKNLTDLGKQIYFQYSSWFLRLKKGLATVCCTQSLPAAAGARMLKLGWEPFKWHFPDAKAGSVDWMISLMAPVMYVQDVEDFYGALNIYLPRCALSQNDFRVLLSKCSKNRVNIYCEHSSLPAIVKSDLELRAKKHDGKISIRWSIHLNWA